MKNTLILLLSTLLLIPHYGNSQKKSDAAAIAAVAGAAVGIGIALASSAQAAKESMERNMVEWVLENKTHSDKTSFELSLINWEATKKEDLNNVSVVGFNYTVRGEKYQNYVLLYVCSQGWWNDYGVDFTKVRVYEIDKTKWSKILLAYMNLSTVFKNLEITDIEKIPVFRTNKNRENSTIPLYYLKSINSTGLYFQDDNNLEYKFLFDESLTGSGTHTVTNIDDEYKLDFNEGNLGIFLKATGDLIRLKREFIVDVTKILFADKLPKTVY